MAEPIIPGNDPMIRALREGRADPVLRHYGARRLLPLVPENALSVLLALADDPDPEIAREAGASISAVTSKEWLHLLDAGSLDGELVEGVARSTTDPLVLEAVARHAAVRDETLLQLARAADVLVQEALVVNQRRLVANPALITALLENPALPADLHRRLTEIREEFFEKAGRRRARDLESPEPLPSEETAGGGEEGSPAPAPEEKREIRELHQRLAYLTVSEKIETALKGNHEERSVLIRDVAKPVREAVLRSPSLTEQELIGFASMRNVEEDVFRRIAGNKDWIRRYLVVLALVGNPKVPCDLGVTLVKYLRIRDLRRTAHDRNLPDAVRLAARKFYNLKRT